MPAATAANLPIRTISSLTGVHAVTLRAWERRYGLIRPARTPKGHRLYTHQHVERIRRVLALMERGVPISRVRDLLDAEPSAETAAASGRWRPDIERMAAAIARFDEQELDRIYDEALSVHPIEQVTQRLLLPLLIQLGERWRDLAGGIAEEHFFAMYLRSKLGARMQHRMRYATGPRLVAACAPGEQHEIGLLLFALEAHVAGMRTVLLGADTPLPDLAIARQRSQGDAVVISSSVDPAPSFFNDALPQLVGQAGVPVFVGGSTAIRHRREVSAAGAVPLGVELEDGVRLVATTLAREAPRP
ncbi:MAG TPA: MerR family transcriptional regulator [Steroidobacteraceae bacterium]|nr:MerR family transcriptional regulator [Steroidobacteraceae bacterium]